MPFLLRPDMPPEGMVSQRRPGMENVRNHLQEVAKEAGLVMATRERTSNPLLALEMTEYAKEVGKVDTFHGRVMKAYWSEALDIGDPEVLKRLAAEAGLDAAGFAEALESRRFKEQFEAKLDIARQLNIHAVPSFVFEEKYLVQGAQPYEVFKKVVQEYVLPGRESEG